MALAYYNEIDPYAAQWLRNLIAAGLIAPGDVDERDIRLVQAADLRGYAQCHFFAGIGGWSYALRLAGWDDARPVWTGSCPCQPFSSAGKRQGTRDPRHLWPEFRRLIGECRPPVVFGEQVAGQAGLLWLDGVSSDLEVLGYSVGSGDLCAAGVGAPHIRQRLWWVADSIDRGCWPSRTTHRGKPVGYRDATENVRPAVANASPPIGLDNAMRPRHGRATNSVCTGGHAPRCPGVPGGVGDTSRSGLAERQSQILPGTRRQKEGRAVAEPGTALGFWTDFDIITCLDDKFRRVEPGTFPLAHGVPCRVGKLRAYGNAIVPQVAAEFIMAYMETIEAPHA